MNTATSATFAFEVYYDGACPLCAKEIAWLRARDRNHRIRFTDIDSEVFDPTVVGKTYEELMERIHGRLPNGTWVEGVEVFRRLYSAVGFVRLTALSRLPIVSQVLDLGYFLFAKYRLRLTGRCAANVCGLDKRANRQST